MSGNWGTLFSAGMAVLAAAWAYSTGGALGITLVAVGMIAAYLALMIGSDRFRRGVEDGS